MINKEMSNYNTENNEKNLKKDELVKPNEHGGFYFSSSFKIFDPNSKEILVQNRGDY